jgi:putative membrane protein
MLFIRWIVSAIAIGITAYLLPGVSITLIGALVLAVVLGIINLYIKPVVMLITLPVNIVTLGLFTLVINAALVLLAALVVPGFHVAGFWWAMLFALVLSLVNTVLGMYATAK